MGNDETQRVTVLRCQRLAIVVSGEQNFFAVKVGKRHIGGESLLGVNQDVRRFWPGVYASEQLAGMLRRPNGCRSGSSVSRNGNRWFAGFLAMH